MKKFGVLAATAVATAALFATAPASADVMNLAFNQPEDHP